MIVKLHTECSSTFVMINEVYTN